MIIYSCHVGRVNLGFASRVSYSKPSELLRLIVTVHFVKFHVLANVNTLLRDLFEKIVLWSRFTVAYFLFPVSLIC